MFLLDTNVLSELRRRHKMNASVAAWVEATDPADLYISTMTILEIEIGALLIKRRDEAQARILNEWIHSKILPSFAGRILPVTTEVALACARLHVPDPRPDLDALIAATALVHRLTLVTRNVADFAATGVEVVNPFTA